MHGTAMHAARCMLLACCSWGALHEPVHRNAARMPLLNKYHEKVHAALCHIGRLKALTTPTSMMHNPSKYLPGPAQTHPQGDSRQLQEFSRHLRPILRRIAEIWELPDGHLEV